MSERGGSPAERDSASSQGVKRGPASLTRASRPSRGSRRLEIWGRVGGADVLLLRTDDAQRFGRVYRALQRALDGGSVPR